MKASVGTFSETGIAASGGLLTVLTLALSLSVLIPCLGQAALPLYVEDWHSDIHNWAESRSNMPDLAALIRDHAVVYQENTYRDGDLAHFMTSSAPPESAHYVSFGGLWFEGMPSWMDPDQHMKRTEDGFYHSADPATFTGWRRADGAVELHWTPDLRWISTDADFQNLNRPDLISQVTAHRFVVRRTDESGQIVEFGDTVTITPRCFVDGHSFMYVDQAGPGTYTYSLLSVPPMGGAPVAFAADSLVIQTSTTGPHFWAARGDFQERLYPGLVADPNSNPTLADTMRFYVDQEVDPSSLTVQRVTKYSPDPWIPFETVNYTVGNGLQYAYDADAEVGVVTCAFEAGWDAYLKKKGGVVYRLRYQPAVGAPVYFPGEMSGNRKQFIWSSVNNRVLNRTWTSYLMNGESESWRQTVTNICDSLGRGLLDASGYGHPIAYDSVFLDAAMAVIVRETHNDIKPREFVSEQTCRTANIATVKYICDHSTAHVAVNTRDLGLIQGLAGYPGFVGLMNENLVSQPNGWLELANLLWLFRGHPDLRNLYRNGYDYWLAYEREQAVATYLLAREPVQAGSARRSSFGSGDWEAGPVAYRDSLVILPEQMLSVGDALEDPLAGVAWPAWPQWTTYTASQGAFVNWVETVQAPGSAGFIRHVGGRKMAVMEFELDDGLPGVANSVAAVWDLGPDATGTYRLSDIWPEKTDATFHRFHVSSSPAPVAVTSGGVFSTYPVHADSTIPVAIGDVALYFTAPVRSPEIAPQAESAVEATEGVPSRVVVRASHWNAVALDSLRLRVSPTMRGAGFAPWPDLVYLRDDGLGGDDVAGDSFYTYEGPPIAAVYPGTYEFPIMAVGSDDLRTYGTIEVPVSGPVTIAGRAEYPLLGSAAGVDVAFAVRVQAEAPIDSVSVDLAGLGGSGSRRLWDNGLGDDAAAGDGIFTSSLFNVALSPTAAYSAHVSVRTQAGGFRQRDVAVEVVTSLARFRDISQSAGVDALRLGSTGQPYASILFNTSRDTVQGREAMVVTFDDLNTLPLFVEHANPPGAPAAFEPRASAWIAPGAALAAGARGVTACDYDNDAKSDFFLCGAENSVLFGNGGTRMAPQFGDSTAAAFGPEADLLAGALIATWRDYNSDGFEDVYVATSDYTGAVGDIGDGAGMNFEARVFRNDGHGAFRWRFRLAPTAGSVRLSGVWSALMGYPQRPWVVSPWVFDGFLLAAHQPTRSEDDDWTLITLPWVIEENGQPASLFNVNSITNFDYNSDAYPDLLVTDSGGQGRAVILQNAYDPVTLSHKFTVVPLDAGRQWTGACIADFDGNTLDDILLLPQSGEPGLFMADGAVAAPTFATWPSRWGCGPARPVAASPTTSAAARPRTSIWGARARGSSCMRTWARRLATGWTWMSARWGTPAAPWSARKWSCRGAGGNGESGSTAAAGAGGRNPAGCASTWVKAMARSP